MADPTSGARRAGKRARPEPDASLARDRAVQYRYTLSLSDPGEARGIFQIADELGAVVRYLVLVQDGTQGGPRRRYRAYLGLGSSDCFDLPLRLAARGIQIERGEQMANDAPVPGENVTFLRRR